MNWISVKDKLPDPFRAVYVSCGVALWTGTKWNTITGCAWPGETIHWEVTHWAELEKQPAGLTLDKKETPKE